eukprot:CAMPEP_0196585196 /NCGR_PEP_ID=MMETSP1081-20130531/49843_1 /TAXON_ID=36882 /ORGANISM="Pyramimonas amylifera, Strain CCMP720" /LENGTH=141 /DNA_ID=CAMNT_0041906665 /DNA_START=72 /DNA_END=497 /DNA_ORIENTATION=+
MTSSSTKDENSTPTKACTECKLIARAIEVQCLKLEKGDDEEDHYLAETSRQRRRLQHGRSELRIRDTLSEVCTELGKAGGHMIPEVMHACARLLAEHGEDLGDIIYEHGPYELAGHLCVDLANVCPEEAPSSQSHHTDGEL